MAYEAKPEAPALYWLDPLREIVELFDGNRVMQNNFRCLLGGKLEQELIETAEFCTVLPDDFVEPTEEQFADGSYVDNYKNAGLRNAFYKLCQEV